MSSSPGGRSGSSVSRRQFSRLAGAVGLGGVVAPLAACSDPSSAELSPQRGSSVTTSANVSLSPRNWPRDELAKYTEINKQFGVRRPLATGGTAMISGTSGALAVHAGYRVLENGGNAVDAAIATSLAQVPLAMGSWNSYAGIFYLVYYDASTRKVSALQAGYNTPLAEKEPLTIPADGPSGRTALVPGFLAGIGEAHRRFGHLPLASLCEPAIYLADEGIYLEATLAGVIQYRRDVLSRRPETRRISTKSGGGFYGEDDILRQAALAASLKRFAADGPDYFYTGPWAEKFVRAVAQEGGKLSMEDMRRYRVRWTESTSSSYRGLQVHSLDHELGSTHLFEAINVLELANLAGLGHYSESPEAMYQLMQICRLANLGTYSEAFDPRIDARPGRGRVTTAERVSKAAAERNWTLVQKRGWGEKLYRELNPTDQEPPRQPSGGHSDGVVVIDAAGNAAAVCHTFNGTLWGRTGIFVDGISVPDSGSINQYMMHKVGRGAQLPNHTVPLIALRDGRPALMSSTINDSLHTATVQNLHNVVDFGRDPKVSVETPNFHSEDADPAITPFAQPQRVYRGDFDRSLLKQVRRLGQPIKEVSRAEAIEGLWIGIQHGDSDRGLSGAANSLLNSLTEGG